MHAYFLLLLKMKLAFGVGRAVLVRSVEDVDRYLGQVRKAAADAHAWVAAQTGDPIDFLRHMNSTAPGFIRSRSCAQHGRADQPDLDLRRRTCRRPAVAGVAPGCWRLSLGTRRAASKPLDVMSEIDGMVGAETFAAVDPANNRKLAGDLVKMAARTQQHRYIFSMSPKFPGAQRLPQSERAGVEVWSVDV